MYDVNVLYVELLKSVLTFLLVFLLVSFRHTSWSLLSRYTAEFFFFFSFSVLRFLHDRLPQFISFLQFPLFVAPGTVTVNSPMTTENVLVKKLPQHHLRRTNVWPVFTPLFLNLRHLTSNTKLSWTSPLPFPFLSGCFFFCQTKGGSLLTQTSSTFLLSGTPYPFSMFYLSSTIWLVSLSSQFSYTW